MWTLPTLLTHDPLQNTGWAVRAKSRPMCRWQRRDRQNEEVSTSKRNEMKRNLLQFVLNALLYDDLCVVEVSTPCNTP